MRWRPVEGVASLVTIMGEEKLVYSSVSEKEEFEDPSPPQNAPKGFGVRHTQVLLLFISLTIAFTMRAQLSVSMVAMTNPNIIHFNQVCNKTTEVTETIVISTHNDTVAIDNSTACDGNKGTELSKWNVYRTYDWHKSTQEMILFSFFVGYTTMMMPIGIIAQKYGGKIPIVIALAVNGVASILTPWVPIFSGWIGMCIVRLLQGSTQAAFFPSIHTILGKWAPVSERGRLSTYVYTGSQFGTILIFQISGLFAGSPSLGWPSIFWLCGVLSLACLALYSWLGSATPHEHPGITAEELMHIMGDGSADVKKRKTPWKHILTSTAVWGLVASHAGSAIGYILVLTQTPTYMSKVLSVDIRHNGVYSSLPYIAMYVLALAFGQVSDLFLARKIMSIANIRRTANTIGMVISAIFLVAFGFVRSTSVAVTLLVLCIGLHSGVHVGFHINQIDLAPNFAGPIMALGNMLANLTSLLVPVLVSNLIGDDVTNQQRWQILFIAIAAFQVVTNIIFVIFVKGEVQPWNFYGEDSYENDADMYALKEKNKQLVQEMKSLNEKPSAERTT